MKMKGQTALRWLLLLAPAIFVTIVIIAPFIDLVGSNFSTTYFSTLTGSSPVAVLTRRAIRNSLLQGGVSALLAFAAGFPLGLFMGMHSFRFKRAITSLVLVPFFLPSIIVVFAFISGFGQASPIGSAFPFARALSNGFPGIIAVNTFFNAPLVALFTMTSVEQADISQVEAASTLGASKLKQFATIWGKDAIAAAAGGSLLTFTYSFAGFAAPLIIGGPGSFTMDAWIYFMVKTLGNTQAAITLSLFEALILIIPAAAYVIFASKIRGAAGTGTRAPYARKLRGGWFKAGAAYLAAWLILEIYLLSSIFAESLRSGSAPWWHFANFYQLFSPRASSAIGISAAGAIANSLFYGISASLLVVSIGLMWITGQRRLGRRRIFSEFMQYVPLVISSIIMAFSLSAVFGLVTPASLLWGIIILAQAGVAVPVVLRVIDSGFSSIPGTYTEASLTMGGNPFFEVELPMGRSTFASALMFGFAISLGEFSATNFLATQNYISLTVEIYMLQDIRMLGASYAAAAILLILSLASFYVIQRMGERFIGFR